LSFNFWRRFIAPPDGCIWLTPAIGKSREIIFEGI
jgi:hypothetical protein